MTIAVDMGCKATKQTNKKQEFCSKMEDCILIDEAKAHTGEKYLCLEPLIAIFKSSPALYSGCSNLGCVA